MLHVHAVKVQHPHRPRRISLAPLPAKAAQPSLISFTVPGSLQMPGLCTACSLPKVLFSSPSQDSPRSPNLEASLVPKSGAHTTGELSPHNQSFWNITTLSDISPPKPHLGGRPGLCGA